jgi:hypothetical protein
MSCEYSRCDAVLGRDGEHDAGVRKEHCYTNGVSHAHRGHLALPNVLNTHINLMRTGERHDGLFFVATEAV